MLEIIYDMIPIEVFHFFILICNRVLPLASENQLAHKHIVSITLLILKLYRARFPSNQID